MHFGTSWHVVPGNDVHLGFFLHVIPGIPSLRVLPGNDMRVERFCDVHSAISSVSCYQTPSTVAGDVVVEG